MMGHSVATLSPLSTLSTIGRTCIALVAFTALAGCSAAAPTSQLSQAGAPGGAVQPADGAFAPAAVPPKAANGAAVAVSDSTSAADVTARLIVRNASLTLIVQDTQTQLDAIAKLATDLGGYVSSSSSQKYDAGLQAKVTFRVPTDQLNPALDRLHKMAIEVREEQISGNDVTAEYTDLNSRLKNLEAAEAQLRDIMSKAQRTEDVMSVFNQLTQIRGEIEQTKGRIQYLSQSASMATIDVTLIPDKLAQPVQIAGWRPDGVAKSAVEALISALQGIATLVIWLVIVVLPVGLVVASPFVLLIWILRRNRRKQQLAKPAAK